MTVPHSQHWVGRMSHAIAAPHINDIAKQISELYYLLVTIRSAVRCIRYFRFRREVMRCVFLNVYIRLL